ncbi:hypothetical protein [Hymenobacter rubidus]|uniref:hypothetical protein n=1 Tax=Hymenobacter rubidus TaxID=1441626 RepID=UPI00191D498C|nr:hypothetical protein [Hymenobacter rubidus]
MHRTGHPGAVHGRQLFRIDADYRVRLAHNFGRLSGDHYGVRRSVGPALWLLQRPERCSGL